MINHILLTCFTIIIYEFVSFFQLKNFIKQSLNIYQKIIKLFRLEKASDFRKEKLILNYSKSLFLLSSKIFITILLILILLYILGFLSNTFIDFIVSVFGIVELTFIFMIYHILRKKFNEKLQ